MSSKFIQEKLQKFDYIMKATFAVEMIGMHMNDEGSMMMKLCLTNHSMNQLYNEKSEIEFLISQPEKSPRTILKLYRLKQEYKNLLYVR